jgi:regulator of nucleoside diphosphate kinase
MSTTDLSPRIVMAAGEHRLLSELATASQGSAAAEALLDELERAEVVDDESLPASVVRMGSRVRFATEGQGERLVELVYPVDADIAAGKVSVLTPVGAALIGLSDGQTITWETRDGREQALKVLAVEPPRG